MCVDKCDQAVDVQPRHVTVDDGRQVRLARQNHIGEVSYLARAGESLPAGGPAVGTRRLPLFVDKGQEDIYTN